MFPPNQAIDDHLASLPDDRRVTLAALRQLINDALPPGYQEGFSYGMISWSVPLEVYPDTYNKQPLMYLGLASKKNAVSLHLLPLYGDPATEAWFRAEWAKTGKKLDLGKACLRFKTPADLPLELIRQTVARVPLERYVAAARAVRAGRPARAKS
ncbi:MAG: DUF1801 domain-containing protein [Spirochaetales bacterium]